MGQTGSPNLFNDFPMNVVTFENTERAIPDVLVILKNMRNLFTPRQVAMHFPLDFCFPCARTKQLLPVLNAVEEQNS